MTMIGNNEPRERCTYNLLRVVYSYPRYHPASKGWSLETIRGSDVRYTPVLLAGLRNIRAWQMSPPCQLPATNRMLARRAPHLWIHATRRRVTNRHAVSRESAPQASCHGLVVQQNGRKCKHSILGARIKVLSSFSSLTTMIAPA